jgi:hypothetical protein
VTVKDKFSADDGVKFDYVAQIDDLCDDIKEVVCDFPAYVGLANLARFLSLPKIVGR